VKYIVQVIQHYSDVKARLNVISTDICIFVACYRSPDSVMMCILPEDASNDVALHIHFTLIEAFCLENDIRVVKVQFFSEFQLISFNNSHIIAIVVVLHLALTYYGILLQIICG